MDKELLWWAYRWVDTDGLEHTITYDCKTGEFSEEWHPIEGKDEQRSS